MGSGHWIMLGLTEGLIAALLAFSLCYDPKRRFFAGAKRMFFRVSLLLFSGLAGGIGLNALTGAVTIFLGLPGYAALAVLAML